MSDSESASVHRSGDESASVHGSNDIDADSWYSQLIARAQAIALEPEIDYEHLQEVEKKLKLFSEIAYDARSQCKWACEILSRLKWISLDTPTFRRMGKGVRLLTWSEFYDGSVDQYAEVYVCPRGELTVDNFQERGWHAQNPEEARRYVFDEDYPDTIYTPLQEFFGPVHPHTTLATYLDLALAGLTNTFEKFFSSELFNLCEYGRDSPSFSLCWDAIRRRIFEVNPQTVGSSNTLLSAIEARKMLQAMKDVRLFWSDVLQESIFDELDDRDRQVRARIHDAFVGIQANINRRIKVLSVQIPTGAMAGCEWSNEPSIQDKIFEEAFIWPRYGLELLRIEKQNKQNVQSYRRELEHDWSKKVRKVREALNELHRCSNSTISKMQQAEDTLIDIIGDLQTHPFCLPPESDSEESDSEWSESSPVSDDDDVWSLVKNQKLLSRTSGESSSGEDDDDLFPGMT